MDFSGAIIMHFQLDINKNFFKESVSFEAGKMPSQKEKANEAYLQLVTIAENCCLWFKKTFSLKNGIEIQLIPCGTS
jgi:hypothetical protein